MLVTAIGYQNSVSTIYFEKPETVYVNYLHILFAIPAKKRLELHDVSGKNILFIKETPEEYDELVMKDRGL